MNILDMIFAAQQRSSALFSKTLSLAVGFYGTIE
jgi:hypothetical protein